MEVISNHQRERELLRFAIHRWDAELAMRQWVWPQPSAHITRAHEGDTTEGGGMGKKALYYCSSCGVVEEWPYFIRNIVLGMCREEGMEKEEE